MALEINFFTDLIDALGKVAGGLKTIVNLPKAERESIRRTLNETYRLIDTTLNMVIIRLGDILLQTSDDDFLREGARLDNYNEWRRAEREFRPCCSLRVVPRETETLAGRLAGVASTRGWDIVLQQMRIILATEDEVAEFIGRQFRQITTGAHNGSQYAELAHSVRDALTAFRAALIAERQELLKEELAQYAVVQ